MFGWPPACDTMLGANVEKIAPTHAAVREFTNLRERTRYQEMPVPASARVRNVLNATCGPKRRVTGVNGNVMANTEDVGERFPEEARRIHYGESEERGIRGRASPRDTEALLEEGIGVLPLPVPDALKETLQ